jgi:hypothetical protein
MLFEPGESCSRMTQTFPLGTRLTQLKGTHKPLIHPPSGFCRAAEAFFCTSRFNSGTSGVASVQIRTPARPAELMRAAPRSIELRR